MGTSDSVSPPNKKARGMLAVGPPGAPREPTRAGDWGRAEGAPPWARESLPVAHGCPSGPLRTPRGPN
eukprot:2008287-Pyramimonas_sp.AAC.1